MSTLITPDKTSHFALAERTATAVDLTRLNGSSWRSGASLELLGIAEFLDISNQLDLQVITRLALASTLLVAHVCWEMVGRR
ncbi:hypothetical protein N181_31185 [Sinorhizobium fredii USDA 205]|nr:hypothetical protein N181_31185 [Sinorhizobium fredii USDA 205]